MKDKILYIKITLAEFSKSAISPKKDELSRYQFD